MLNTRSTAKVKTYGSGWFRYSTDAMITKITKTYTNGATHIIECRETIVASERSRIDGEDKKYGSPKGTWKEEIVRIY